MRKTHALAVMVKSPVAGTVKTRLVPPLSMEEAAALYKFFIKDILASVAALSDLDLFVAVLSADDSDGLLSSTIPDALTCFDQAGSTLGERLYNVFERLFRMGYSRVAVIGSDSPDLNPELIDAAFTILKDNVGKVVLGPALDGGYYLIAMDSLDRRPFEDISWSTGSVLDETIKRLDGSAVLLEPWYDIDTAGDILKLARTRTAKESVAYLEGRDLFARVREYLLEMEK